MSARGALAVPALLAVVTACGVGDLSADDVATKAEDALEEQVGVRPTISCPEDLAAEVGATTRCTFTAGDDPTEYGVQVTVTSVDDDAVRFDVELDERPTS
jgi:Domain of unknown function (DUF4333)